MSGACVCKLNILNQLRDKIKPFPKSTKHTHKCIFCVILIYYKHVKYFYLCKETDSVGVNRPPHDNCGTALLQG